MTIEEDAAESDHALPWLASLAPAAPSAPQAPNVAGLPSAASLAVGTGPALWAIEVGDAITARIIREMPEFGGANDSVELLRMGTESAALQALLVLAGENLAQPASSESLEGVIDFVRRGISLDSVLRGIRLGHAGISAAFLAACELLADPDERAEQMKFLSDRLFDYIDAFSAAMAGHYIQEQIRWSTSDSAARLEVVASVLDGSQQDGRYVGSRLGYDVNTSHIGMLVWSSPHGVDSDTVELQGVTASLLRRVKATQRLVVPVGVGRVWAWFNTSLPYQEVVDRLRDTSLPPATHLTLGSPATGMQGFRQTHREAIATFELLEATTSDLTVVSYRDVDLLSLLLSNETMALAFARRELGALAAPTAQAKDLRETLTAYLDEESNTHATAERMHIARNTVTYRVHKAEELLQRKVSHRRHQLHAALLILDAVGDLAPRDNA